MLKRKSAKAAPPGAGKADIDMGDFFSGGTGKAIRVGASVPPPLPKKAVATSATPKKIPASPSPTASSSSIGVRQPDASASPLAAAPRAVPPSGAPTSAEAAPKAAASPKASTVPASHPSPISVKSKPSDSPATEEGGVPPFSPLRTSGASVGAAPARPGSGILRRLSGAMSGRRRSTSSASSALPSTSGESEAVSKPAAVPPPTTLPISVVSSSPLAAAAAAGGGSFKQAVTEKPSTSPTGSFKQGFGGLTRLDSMAGGLTVAAAAAASNVTEDAFRDKIAPWHNVEPPAPEEGRGERSESSAGGKSGSGAFTNATRQVAGSSGGGSGAFMNATRQVTGSSGGGSGAFTNATRKDTAPADKKDIDMTSFFAPSGGKDQDDFFGGDDLGDAEFLNPMLVADEEDLEAGRSFRVGGGSVAPKKASAWFGGAPKPAPAAAPVAAPAKPKAVPEPKQAGGKPAASMASFDDMFGGGKKAAEEDDMGGFPDDDDFKNAAEFEW